MMPLQSTLIHTDSFVPTWREEGFRGPICDQGYCTTSTRIYQVLQVSVSNTFRRREAPKFDHTRDDNLTAGQHSEHTGTNNATSLPGPQKGDVSIDVHDNAERIGSLQSAAKTTT